MNYKFNSLYDKIYKNFIRGVYGDPKIPTKAEVTNKINEITSNDYSPVTNQSNLADLDINKLSSSFYNIIDDLDVLFSSVERESQSILDQLTNSLKEHNGTKREIKQINKRADDISVGKLGDSNLQYNFTEIFEDLSNIDTTVSGPVDLENGCFSISNDLSRNISLNHYNGKKLEFSVVQNYSHLKSYGYLGTTDAGTILDPDDSRTLTYQVVTNKPTPLKIVTSIQLTSNAEPVLINGLLINIDSILTKGKLRIYYRGKDAAWHDVKPVSIKNINSDKIEFSFDPIDTSHIKLEFIKNKPDVNNSNEYLIAIKSLVIFNASRNSSAILQSKPISIQSYDNEHPVVESLTAKVDIDITNESNYKLYVAKDVKISGAFKDYQGNVVSAESPNIYTFDSSYADYVYLSDLLSLPNTISGIAVYKSRDYEWLELSDKDSVGTSVSKTVDFNLTYPNNLIDNSLYTNGKPSYLFGDSTYTGPWPTGTGDWYLSGWCNSDNAWWDPYLSGMVGSGILVSGVDVAALLGIPYTGIQDQYGNLHADILSHPLYSGQWLGYGSGDGQSIGYIFGYKDPSTSLAIKFGEYDENLNGWWRPSTTAIGPTGLLAGYIDENGELLDIYKSVTPDFKIANHNFWKIYKFGTTENVILPSIRLYTYQERPVGSQSDYYPHSFIWQHKKTSDIKSSTKEGLTGDTSLTTFEGYTLDISDLISSEDEYIFDGISEIRLHNTNVVLVSDDYTLTPASSKPTTIDLSLLATTKPHLTTNGASFDVTYTYRSKNEYQSKWVGYAIVSSNSNEPNIKIPNIDIYGKPGVPVIDKITVENLDTGDIKTYKSVGDAFNIDLQSSNSTSNTHYKISIFCASDDETGYCAKFNRYHSWVPYHKSDRKSITVSPGIKIVSNLHPLKITTMGDMVNNPSLALSKAALYSTLNNDKYIVVKQPSKRFFPGYYFNETQKEYKEYKYAKIPNRGHWIRRGYASDFSKDIVYTTGSSGVNPGSLYITSTLAISGVRDNTWNNGSCLIKYPNTSGNVFYPVHTTFGYPINIDASETQTVNEVFYDGDIDPRAPTIEKGYVGSTQHLLWLSGYSLSQFTSYNSNNAYNNNQGGLYSVTNEIVDNKGFLYYNTGENLPEYYSISYKVLEDEQDNDSRFLYKLIVSSNEDSDVKPVIRSIRFIANEDI